LLIREKTFATSLGIIIHDNLFLSDLTKTIIIVLIVLFVFFFHYDMHTCRMDSLIVGQRSKAYSNQRL